MRRALLFALAGSGVLVVLGVLVFDGGAPAGDLQLELKNANGLRKGSQVKIGGAVVGKISRLRVIGQSVRADLDLGSDTHLGQGASFAISTANLLGAKFIAVEPGDRRRPLAPGTIVLANRVSVATDLDQVIDVLDADTRTRLGILINELGLAVTGRQQDLRGALAELPPSAQAATRLLKRVVTDNRTLADTVQRTDRAVAALAPERERIVRALDDTATVLEDVAARRDELQQTLRRTPATLRKARRLLSQLRATTLPLGPAARSISAAAPSLRTTLAELESFTHAATPALRAARKAAPKLTSLSKGATPVVRRALPTVAALRTLIEAAPPLTKTLDGSVADALGLVEGWARTIQTRDGLSHTFRARALVSQDLIDSLARNIGPAPTAKTSAPARRKQPATPPSSAAPPRPTPGATQKKPSADGPASPAVGPAVSKLLQDLLGGSGKGQSSGASGAPASAGDVAPLLDYLLGR